MSGWLPLTIANIDLKVEKERLEHAVQVLEEALKVERNDFWKDIEILENELFRVSVERDELRSACEFYADDLSWHIRCVPGYKTAVSDIEMGLGMRAKRALGEGL